MYCSEELLDLMLMSRQTLPLMNVIFGQLVGSFNEYFIPGATITKQEFQKSLNQQTYVCPRSRTIQIACYGL